LYGAGYDEVFEHDFPADALVAAQERNGVDITIVQPGACVLLETVQRQHDAIAAFAARHPGRFFGMTNPNPHLPEEIYRREVTRCIRELGFVGIKIHPLAHAVNPAGQVARRCFALAAEFDVPLMIHTGAGVPFALPSMIVKPAQQFPNVRIVMAHSGTPIYAAEALLVAQLCPNVALETTWTGPQTVHHFVAAIGAERVLFGSDHAVNQATELEKIRTSGISEEEIVWCLGRTAASLYRLSG
jgi:predicted TIM-barrel fold metal-dependent hydrolase